MTEEYDKAKRVVLERGCRICPACDVVPNDAGLHDLYCELLSVPGQLNEPVVRNVPPGQGAPLPQVCPYFRRINEE